MVRRREGPLRACCPPGCPPYENRGLFAFLSWQIVQHCWNSCVTVAAPATRMKAVCMHQQEP